MRTVQVQVAGDRAGRDTTVILDPVFFCQGKLQAAATRVKFTDASDLIFLESKHSSGIRAHNNELNRYQVGMALKRYPHLEHSFARLGLSLDTCEAVARDIDIDALASRPPEPNSVQNALLFNPRVA